MLRLFLVFFGAIFSLTAFVVVDYSMSSRASGTEDSEGLTFNEYLAGYGMRVPDFRAMFGGPGSGGRDATLPVQLADMMPKPPKGWTVRPTEEDDAKAFLPRNTRDVPQDAIKYVENVAKPRSGKGLDQIALTYENGKQQVVFQAVRYPDIIFTSFMAMQQRTELQMMTSPYYQTEFMTVRGLDIVEDLLPKAIGARYFSTDVGAQIQVRVLASRGLSDTNLLAFFETLHVKAMNNSVVDRTDGLGDVPVIVLASGLDQATRDDYDADRIARQKAETADREASRKAEEAAATAEDGSTNKEDKASTQLKGEGRLDMKGKTLPTECETRAGTKFCGVIGDAPVDNKIKKN